MNDDEKGGTSVQVFVRARPLSQKEKLERAQVCVQLVENTNQVCLGDKMFTFDKVFASEASQNEVYSDCGEQMLTRFLKGYNCTMLAYGQTGSGKTFTMGTEETKESSKKDTAGIIPRLVSQMFQIIENSTCPSSYKVTVSMLEIYLEDVIDLLTISSGPLSIREQKGAVFVQNLSTYPVTSLDETMSQLEKGCAIRTKGSTAMNDQSSRSHAIFTINLQKTAISEGECSFNAKFHLVDLAGSERLKKTQAEGNRKKEGIKINEELLALGNVIQGLSDGVKHVPYRDSKITRLLQDSLGGNSCTIMIACISPADINIEESLSTLRYADRAKRIKNSAIINVDPQEARLKEREENLNVFEYDEESRATYTTMGEYVITDQASTRPPVPKKFFMQWNQEADRQSTSSQMSVFAGKQMPSEPHNNKNMNTYFLKLRSWAVQQQNLQAGLLQNMKDSAMSFDPKLRAALCTLDYRTYELKKLKVQKIKDDAALARANAELKQTKRELLSLRARLKHYEEEDARAVNAEEQNRVRKKSEHERLKETQRALKKINELCESTVRSPSVAQLKSAFNQMATSQPKTPVSAARKPKEENERVVGNYNLRYQRRSKSAPRMLVHQAVNRVPTGNIQMQK